MVAYLAGIFELLGANKHVATVHKTVAGLVGRAVSPTPEIIADPRCTLAESPLWHPAEGALYWIDIPTGRLFRSASSGDGCEELLQTEVLGGLAIQAPTGLLLLCGDGFIGLFEDGSLHERRALRHGQRGYRFNDALADPHGRVFAGTMAYARKPRGVVEKIARRLRRAAGVKPKSGRAPGNLYRFDPDGAVSVVVRGVGRPNGMGFSPDRRIFYATDTLAQQVFAFDYQEETGEIANQRPLIRIADSDGRPDGLTVDADGCLWCALMDGGCVVRFTATGREIDRIHFPTQRLTSVIFGGEDYRDLYVTSAGGDRRDIHGDVAGAVFRVRLTTPGLPEYRSRLPFSFAADA